ncbi:hypothetical protein TNIN_67251 [Trichonephila inaurata madagascariensis]|uniref:Uncharacterized protein n=1 Tax=Trichonephila inaurata madagascariensis TaxID=2747483 RepID=A0A8X6JMM2_9ARAC|nr:hypothetical protein TNIN_67251 [Trichonephila inaurata madagascariensis]
MILCQTGRWYGRNGASVEIRCRNKMSNSTTIMECHIVLQSGIPVLGAFTNNCQFSLICNYDTLMNPNICERHATVAIGTNLLSSRA